MSSEELAQQLVDLQTRFSCQEDTVQALTELVETQRRELRRLERLVGELQQSFDAILLTTEGAAADAPPPHY